MIDLPLSDVGRVLLSSEEKEVHTVVLGFHGYGEVAESQMRRMQMLSLLPQNTLLVSVQALYPFLISTGEERFSWVKKGNKGISIQENRAYINRILKQLKSQITWNKLIVCGHSQGSAMAWRTVQYEKVGDILLPFAGEIPADIRGQKAKHLCPIYIGRGLQDQVISLASWRRDLEYLEKQAVDYTVWEEDGEHTWSQSWAEAAHNFINKKL